MEMYSARREARDWLEFWENPDLDAELENTKQKIHKLHYLPKDKPRRKVAVTDAKQLLKNFLTLCTEAEMIADLMLYIPETTLHWLMDRRGIGMKGNRKRLETDIEAAGKFIESSGLEDRFNIRLTRLKDEMEVFYREMPNLTTRGGRMNRWLRWYH